MDQLSQQVWLFKGWTSYHNKSGHIPCFTVAFGENSSSAFCPSPHFTCPNIMAIQVTTFQDGILFNTIFRDGNLLNTLKASGYAPTFCIHAQQAIHHKDMNFNHFQVLCVKPDQLIAPPKPIKLIAPSLPN
jgi:hypothetical protein